MEIKLLEIRDRGTFIPAFAVRLAPRSEEEMYLLRTAGYGLAQMATDSEDPYVVLTKLVEVEAQYDPFRWNNARTMRTVHMHLKEHWAELKSGDVVDVEFITGEVLKPKTSQRLGETNIVRTLEETDRFTP